MAMRPRRWLERQTRERAEGQWRALAASTERLELGQLRRLRDEALGLRASLNHFLLGADRRARQDRVTLDALHLPGGTDWRWRPDFMAGPIQPRGIAGPHPGARLGEDATLWHDCTERRLILEQGTSPAATDLSHFDLRIEVFSFSGSFLSLAIALPPEALAGLTRNHVLRLEAGITVERAMDICARLNIGHGPNVDEIVLKLGDMQPGLHSRQVIEFDLAYTEMNEKRLERVWLDLILEHPRMSAVEIHELFLSRHLRAEF